MRLDHPARILALAQIEQDNETGQPGRELVDAAEILTDYEERKGITFEALDTEALAELRTFWQNEASWSVAGKTEFCERVVDLLGLEDAE